MRFSSSLAVAALATLASARMTPRASRNDGANARSAHPDHENDKPFILQTRVKEGDYPGHNGLYVYAYHTGAGLNDAMLDPQESVGNNGTAFTSDISDRFFVVLYDLAGSPYELEPATGTTPYPDLLPVRINVDGAPPSSSNAFYFAYNTLRWTNNINTMSGFGGWLACKSEHGSLENLSVPGVQLFYRSTPGPTPEDCSDVDLVPIY
ncbi:hypothetical protein Sste5346_001932 [Sporothrix stenoceras]|uniref:DUF7907 domain-containing protein n=1 Tax=Sporothrix stenoceras TaxID=5173 RepID=A0ABR3ZLE3_9PEZI